MAEGHIDGIAAGIGKAFAGDDKRREPKIPKGHKIVDFPAFKAAATKQVKRKTRRDG